MNTPINMFDPTRDYKKHEEEYDNAIKSVLNTGNFINGRQVTELENKLAKYIGSTHCICVDNGTDALLVALMSLNIKPNDEVITTPHTWISSAEVISMLGAKPVFVDINPNTFNIDETKIEEKITDKTKAFLIVSLYGQPANFDEINIIASKYNIPVIEDGAQSFGSKYNDKYSCNLTTIGCTSFFPTKPLGCFGDGGACFTNDDDLAIKIRAIKNHGGTKKFQHSFIGINSRLDTIQASVLLVKLKYLNESIKNRQTVANFYTEKINKFNEEFIHHKLICPTIDKNKEHVWAQYSLLIFNKGKRDMLVEKFKECNVNVSIFYPIPLHLQPCFGYLGYNKGDFPVSEEICDRIINLPCYAELTIEEQKHILETLFLNS